MAVASVNASTAACRVVRDGSLLRLENERVRVEVHPALGGKVARLIDKRDGRDVLWRPPRPDATAGGWSDALAFGEPDPATGAGQHGVQPLALEPLACEGPPDQARVVLRGRAPAADAHWTRTLVLHAGEPLLRVHTSIENAGAQPLAVEWQSRVCLALHADMRLDVPAREGIVADADPPGALGVRGERFRYPVLPRPGAAALDVRHAGAVEAGPCHAHYMLTGLHGGWLSATDAHTHTGLALRFDRALLPTVAQWTSLGGPGGAHHAVLAAATAPGAPRVLAPGELLQTTLLAVLYDDVPVAR